MKFIKMKKNNIVIDKQIHMSNFTKKEAFQVTLKLATSLGESKTTIRSQWIGSTKAYWNRQIKKYRKKVRNRQNNYEKAIDFSTEHGESLSILNRLEGTSHSDWVKELRRLRQKVRRTGAMFDKLIAGNQFNKIALAVLKKGKKITTRQSETLWNKMRAFGKHAMTLTKTNGDTVIVPVNENTRNYILDLLRNGVDFEQKDGYGSDILAQYEFDDLESMTFKIWKKPTRVIENKDGKFFPYINTTNIDLGKKYQIYNQEDAYNKDMLEARGHCLIHTLLECGISREIVNSIKLSYSNKSNISKKDLGEISTKINRKIVLHYINKTKSAKLVHKQIFNGSQADEIHIAMYENHYFKFDLTEYSKFSMDNYEEVKEEKDFHNIIERRSNGKYKRKADKSKINSLMLAYKLKTSEHFKQLDLTKFAEASSHIELKNHIYLGNVQNEQRKCFEVSADKDKFTESEIFYADCESYVNGDHHTIQLIGVVNSINDHVDILNVCDQSYDSNEKVSPEQLAVYGFLNILTKNGKQDSLCYFHNLKYDYHLLEQYLNITNKCEKDKQVYSVTVLWKKQVVEFRDSFKILTFALAKFQKTLDLPKHISKKEAISYEYYTKENNNQGCATSTYLDLLSEESQVIFRENLLKEPSYDPKTKTFNPLTYYKEYLRLDCLVLKKGVRKFNKLIKDLTGGMSIYNHLTISSLTDKYMRLYGAYDGVYEVSGNLREYIGRAVYGGRVCVNALFKRKLVEGKIADLDGVSLYPSAIERLCDETGLPLGKCRRYDPKVVDGWRKSSYAVLTVKITKVNKIQKMPFIAHRTEDSIKYSNEPPKEPIIIDSTTLEDYIKFHEIEYEILDGVEWNSGHGPTMGELILDLFKQRLKFKKLKPALAQVIKLMLNSTYGKTIMKKSKISTKIVKNDDKFESYIYNNFNTITKFRKLNQYNYEVTSMCSDDSYNRAHIGCSILSMSKRIMNEVFDIANSLNLPIYYTDTDSIHCNLEDIPAIEKEYLRIYNKPLIGVNLGQFHVDFDLKGAVTEIYATKSIFLGKKSYIDLIESTNAKGEKITGVHYRLKGITKEGVIHSSKEYSNDFQTGCLELYKDLARGTPKRMTLNPYDADNKSKKVLFEFKQGKVSTRKPFYRRVEFSDIETKDRQKPVKAKMKMLKVIKKINK